MPFSLARVFTMPPPGCSPRGGCVGMIILMRLSFRWTFSTGCDDAFLRRLQYIVRFALPDGKLREQLWRRALPADRLDGDIPFSCLAQAELSPARINSVARAAAVAAMDQGNERINTAMVLRALRMELEKNGKALPWELSHLITESVVKEVRSGVKLM